ncbi:ABC transporter ATP-binding protein [Chloroflexota bacterium]
MSLEVNNLVKNYGSGQMIVRAVKGATFSIEAGQFIAVVGPSGSGKTTLLSMLGGLLTPTSGTIIVNSRQVEKLLPGQRQEYRRDHIGFIFQTNNLIPFLTARENLLLMNKIGPSDRRMMNERAQQLLDELELTSRANALVTELSGGERKRVAIARSLMRDPEMVLADEPTANLDSELGRRVVQNLVDGVKGRNKIGIMVTHDLNMAALADGILEMRDGHLNSNLLRGNSILTKQKSSQPL